LRPQSSFFHIDGESLLNAVYDYCGSFAQIRWKLACVLFSSRIICAGIGSFPFDVYVHY
jgi:hypothetical protein